MPRNRQGWRGRCFGRAIDGLLVAPFENKLRARSAPLRARARSPLEGRENRGLRPGIAVANRPAGGAILFGPLVLSFPMSDGLDRLDARVWRAVLLSGLARNGEGIVISDVANEILFCNPRGAQLLERFEKPSRILPDILAAIVTKQRENDDGPRSERLTPSSGSAIYAHIVNLKSAHPARSAIWLREEVLRDERLYDAMHARFGISRRGFQLAQLLRQGLTNRRIAADLGLSEATVKVYLHELYRACGVASRTALVALVEQVGRTS